MIWILMILVVGLFFGAMYLYDEGISEMVGTIVSALSIIIELFLIVCLLVLIFCYPFEVDKKIKMYEEENIKIEEKVKNTVRVYMEFEKDTFTNLFEDSDLTTLLIAYPELNSNELVKSEVELYIDNNAKIKELKEDKINRRVYRFMLYFGK